jgi:LPS export ABC transporter protein LptC
MEKKSRIKWLLAAALLLVLGLLVSYYRNAETPRLIVAPPHALNGPAAAMEGMRAAEFRQGVKRWDLAAERAVYDTKPDRTTLTGVTLVAVGKRSLGPLTLVAPQAEFMNASKDLILPAGVDVTGERRLHFTAGQAVFSNASSLLTARGRVRYVDELIQVEGEDMVFDTETRALQLKHNVRATIQPRAVR